MTGFSERCSKCKKPLGDFVHMHRINDKHGWYYVELCFDCSKKIHPPIDYDKELKKIQRKKK